MTVSTLHANCISKAGSSLEVCLENATKSNGLNMTSSHRVYQARQFLFSAGEAFEGLYILRSGAAKSFISSIDGDEHITRFFYPGDLLGVDGIDKNRYMENILFLETSSVCFVSEFDLNNLIANDNDFRAGILRSMSRTLVVDSAMMMCLSSCSSEQKVARFIIELSSQFLKRGLSGTEFRLSMTRTDIANYMGMALETVSRVFASFQLKQLIRVDNRQLTILHYDALCRLVSSNQSASKVQSDLHSNVCIGAVY